MTEYALLASGNANENYRYLIIQGATHETASAIVKEQFSNVVQISQFSPYVEPADRLPELPRVKQLPKLEGIPTTAKFFANRTIEVAAFITIEDIYVSRLELCRALGKNDCFLSRLAPNASHTVKLAKLGYTNQFRLVHNVVNGGQPLRCISFGDAQLAVDVLGFQETSHAA